MTEKEFEILLKSLTTLTQSNQIDWIKSASTYETRLGVALLKLQRNDNGGVSLVVYNDKGTAVALISADVSTGVPGIEVYRSSIPTYLFQLIAKLERKTDETLESLMMELKSRSSETENLPKA